MPGNSLRDCDKGAFPVWAMIPFEERDPIGSRKRARDGGKGPRIVRRAIEIDEQAREGGGDRRRIEGDREELGKEESPGVPPSVGAECFLMVPKQCAVLRGHVVASMLGRDKYRARGR